MITHWEGMLSIEGDVVLVEDDQTLLSLMTDILEDFGALCHAFASADDALMYMLSTRRRVALVIADHGVPGQINGSELVAMVVQKWPETSTIITSGYDLDGLSMPLRTIYLQKPWSVDFLVSTIARVVQPGAPIRRG